jgi:hypothetical protein
LEKWIHLGCTSSPKLSSLFVLKQLKRIAEAIKDFDNNFALCMHGSLIRTNIHNMAFLMSSKVIAKVHYVGVPMFIHVARKIIYGNTINLGKIN